MTTARPWAADPLWASVTDPPQVLGVGTAVPAFRVDQDAAADVARRLFADGFRDVDRLLSVFPNSGVRQRHLCVPLEWFETEHGLAERNSVYVEQATALGERAAREALDAAGVRADRIGAVFFVSSTGLATPSLDAVLAERLDLDPRVRRDATFGHGCAGGAGGLARAAEWSASHGGAPVLLVAVELCSLAFQRANPTKTNLVATSLFADGAAAAIVGAPPDDASAPRRPAVIGTGSTLWPGTGDVMGWDVTDTGLGVVLDRSVPAVVRSNLAASVDDACRSAGVDRASLVHFVMHPGGAKVLEAIGDALGVGAERLCLSTRTLAEFGNMSAPTVLFVLRSFLDAGRWESGDLALVSAMGPGFAAEHVILRCP